LLRSRYYPFEVVALSTVIEDTSMPLAKAAGSSWYSQAGATAEEGAEGRMKRPSETAG
jgi:hypothetical protein